MDEIIDDDAMLAQLEMEIFGEKDVYPDPDLEPTSTMSSKLRNYYDDVYGAVEFLPEVNEEDEEVPNPAKQGEPSPPKPKEKKKVVKKSRIPSPSNAKSRIPSPSNANVQKRELKKPKMCFGRRSVYKRTVTGGPNTRNIDALYKHNPNEELPEAVRNPVMARKNFTKPELKYDKSFGLSGEADRNPFGKAASKATRQSIKVSSNQPIPEAARRKAPKKKIIVVEEPPVPVKKPGIPEAARRKKKSPSPNRARSESPEMQQSELTTHRRSLKPEVPKEARRKKKVKKESIVEEPPVPTRKPGLPKAAIITRKISPERRAELESAKKAKEESQKRKDVGKRGFGTTGSVGRNATGLQQSVTSGKAREAVKASPNAPLPAGAIVDKKNPSARKAKLAKQTNEVLATGMGAYSFGSSSILKRNFTGTSPQSNTDDKRHKYSPGSQLCDAARGKISPRPPVDRSSRSKSPRVTFTPRPRPQTASASRGPPARTSRSKSPKAPQTTPVTSRARPKSAPSKLQQKEKEKKIRNVKLTPTRGTYSKKGAQIKTAAGVKPVTVVVNNNANKKTPRRPTTTGKSSVTLSKVGKTGQVSSKLSQQAKKTEEKKSVIVAPKVDDSNMTLKIIDQNNEPISPCCDDARIQLNHHIAINASKVRSLSNVIQKKTDEFKTMLEENLKLIQNNGKLTELAQAAENKVKSQDQLAIELEEKFMELQTHFAPVQQKLAKLEEEEGQSSSRRKSVIDILTKNYDRVLAESEENVQRINHLTDKLESLEKVNSALSEKMTSMGFNMTKHLSERSQNECILESIAEENSILEEHFYDYQDQIADLEDSIEEMHSRVDGLEYLNEELSEKNDNLIEEVHNRSFTLDTRTNLNIEGITLMRDQVRDLVRRQSNRIKELESTIRLNKSIG